MPHLEEYFQEDADQSQALLSHSGSPERLQQLRKKHYFPPGRHGTQPIDCQSRTEQNIKRKELFKERAINEENNEQLNKLEAKYLLCGKDSPTIYSKNSQITPLIDGVDYFRHLHELILSTNKGDSIFISGLSIESDIDLQGIPKGQEGHHDLADILAEKAADGVDVRIMVSGGYVISSLPIRRLVKPFRDNLFAAIDFRTRILSTQDTMSSPLERRVIINWMGAQLGSSHQKVVIVSHRGDLTALVGGIDLRQTRYDQLPHNSLHVNTERWGWHDVTALVKGPAAESIWDNFRLRWKEASTLPKRFVRVSGIKFKPINPPLLEAPPEAPKQIPIVNPEVSVQILSSLSKWKIDSLLPAFRKPWSFLPVKGAKEIYGCLTKAIQGASHYIYIEDPYLKEQVGGKSAYEIYPFLMEAARRGIKVILVGSAIYGAGRLNPKKVIWNNHTVSTDIQKKILDRLTPTTQRNVAVYRVEHLKVHGKVILIDDEFASIGTANMFSRSMAGIDHELNVALVTISTHVRDLRVQLWGEHLRSPMTDPDYLNALRDQKTALGIWRSEWLPETAPCQTWRTMGLPKGFTPTERVLKLVGPE